MTYLEIFGVRYSNFNFQKHPCRPSFGNETVFKMTFPMISLKQPILP